jgi:hypothetical protein
LGIYLQAKVPKTSIFSGLLPSFYNTQTYEIEILLEVNIIIVMIIVPETTTMGSAASIL